MEGGALSLASPEVRFQLDRETQNPVDVELKEGKEANSLVEEFMLLANISVASHLQQHFPDTAILRRHPAPPPENFEALNRALAARNPDWHLDVSSSGTLSASLDAAADPADPYLNRLVRIMATRCMLQAQYFAAGTLPYQAFWHYGLACPIYTHFTSPIRRYADVLVHRLLHASIDPAMRGSAINWDKSRGEDLCHNLNYRNRMAQQAQRSSVELFTQLYFKGKTIETDAYVIKTMATGVVVLIPQYGIEGLVPLPEARLLPGITYDATNSRYADGEEKTVLGLFRHVQIRITTETHEVSQRDKISIDLLQPAITQANDGTPPKRNRSD
jgi:exosome complex exonuclease DIS3/RRP44